MPAAVAEICALLPVCIGAHSGITIVTVAEGVVVGTGVEDSEGDSVARPVPVEERVRVRVGVRVSDPVGMLLGVRLSVEVRVRVDVDEAVEVGVADGVRGGVWVGVGVPLMLQRYSGSRLPRRGGQKEGYATLETPVTSGSCPNQRQDLSLGR